jgi:hypothetical protein
MKGAPVANLAVSGSRLLRPGPANIRIHRASKQIEYKVGLVLVAQFQVFHDVREVDFLPASAREDRVHQLRREFVEVGWNWTGLCACEGSNVP